MIGQELDVVALLDSDKAGDEARDHLIKAWLTRYKKTNTSVLSLGEALGLPKDKEFAIEDLFPDEFYLKFVQKAYAKELKGIGVDGVVLLGNDQLCKKVERAFQSYEINFNKGRVAKLLRKHLTQMKEVKNLPEPTQERARKLLTAITSALPELR